MNHPAWEVLQHNIAQNIPEYLTLVSALSIAAVCSMPRNIPTSISEIWTWLRDTLQTAVPAARHQVSVQTADTQKTVTASETTADPTQHMENK